MHLGDRRMSLVQLTPGDPRGPRVLAIPFAGGGPLAFAPLAARLPDDWSLWAVDPPGHLRTRGPLLRSVDAMRDLYLELIPPELLAGAVLLGHSLGGYVAFALAERLEACGRPAPAVVIAAVRPPDRPDPDLALAAMTDEALFAWLLRLGGIPGGAGDPREIFEFYRDVLRADLVAFDTFDAGVRRLRATPLQVIGANGDLLAPAGEVRGWSRYAADCRVELIDADHLFLLSKPELEASLVRGFIDSLATHPEALDHDEHHQA